MFRSPPSLSRLSAPTNSPEGAAMRRKDQDIVELIARSQLLGAELERERTAKVEVERRMDKEKRVWKEGIEAMHSQYQTVQLQYRLALSEERLREMDDRHRLLQMKVSNTVRDHRLSRFQTRETELTWEIQDLTEDADREREEGSARVQETMEELEQVQHDLEKKLARAERHRDAHRQEAEDAKLAAQEAETDLEHLRVQHSTLDAAHRKTSLSLQRLQLELESLKSQEKEWKSRAADWQSLEKRSDKELDKLADVKQGLETKIRELEKELQEQKRKDKGAEKDRKKLASLEAKVERLEELLASAQDKTSEAQQEAHDAQTELGRLQKQLARLQTSAAHEAPATTVPNGRHKPPSSNTAVAMEPSPSPEVAAEPEPAKPARKPRKVAPRKLVDLIASPPASDIEPDDSDEEVSDAPKTKVRKAPAAKTAGVKRPASKMTEKAKTGEKPIPEVGEKENDFYDRVPGTSMTTAPTAPKAAEPAEEEEGQKKKKRRLFGAPSAAPFQWAAGLNTGDGADSMFPNILSPIKGGAPAPQRAGIRALGLTGGRIF
ncbi:hypothetical protein CALVIDRAFT_536309 [Calocera viscosa TUFC12733]|uniref:Uncharacterized protein n=1 Tax=Calocera viscosa (strain TUFC12733) TaxID=1330018 RepID=A0A167N2B3_CALVF|nr:hypothetical protein CALVIDRAFT_536309 [Calocera viscosa TUFC12733]